MAGAWFHPVVVLRLCETALEGAANARTERFFRLTKEDAAPPSWWPWKGKEPSNEELTERYAWVWSDDTSDLGMNSLILRGWIHGAYWRVEEKVKWLTQLARLKAAVNASLEKMDSTRTVSIAEFYRETPGGGIYLTDKELEDLDIYTPLAVHSANEIKPD